MRFGFCWCLFLGCRCSVVAFVLWCGVCVWVVVILSLVIAFGWLDVTVDCCICSIVWCLCWLGWGIDFVVWVCGAVSFGWLWLLQFWVVGLLWIVLFARVSWCCC